MEDKGKERECSFVDSLVQAFGHECVYYSPKIRKTSGQQKELADAMILVPPYAIVFQIKWLHQKAEDFHGTNKVIEQERLEHKMAEAAKQFKRLNTTWRQNSKIELPRVWGCRNNGTYTLDLNLIKHFIPVVIVDFEDQQYSMPGARTNVRPVVTKVPDSIKDWGMVHCFLFRDFKTILDDLFTPGDLMTYLFLREKQITGYQKYLNYSELDFFALYLTKYSEWDRTADSPMLLVESNYYEALVHHRADDFARRRLFFRHPDILDGIVSKMCMHFQNKEKGIESFLLNLGRIKGLPALLKKSIEEHVNKNLMKLTCTTVNTQISMGRFASMIFPHTLYLIGVIVCELEYAETVKDYLYRRALSYIVENEWQLDTKDVFMILIDLHGRWFFVGGRTINAEDYIERLSIEEIERSRISLNVESFKESEWSYHQRFEKQI